MLFEASSHETIFGCECGRLQTTIPVNEKDQDFYHSHVCLVRLLSKRDETSAAGVTDLSSLSLISNLVAFCSSSFRQIHTFEI